MRKLLLAATMLGGLAVAGAASATTITLGQAQWQNGVCNTGINASCTIGLTTITASGNLADATANGLQVPDNQPGPGYTPIPATLRETTTFNNGIGLGVNFARYPGTNINNGGNREIQPSETMTFDFAKPIDLDQLNIIFLYSEERFADDPPQELARITVNGSLVYTLTAINSTSAVPGVGFTFTGPGGSILTNFVQRIAPTTGGNDRGTYRFLDGAFEGVMINSIALTAPFQTNDTTRDNSDYAFLSLQATLVPEPATLALLGAGLLGLGAVARRRRPA